MSVGEFGSKSLAGATDPEAWQVPNTPRESLSVPRCMRQILQLSYSTFRSAYVSIVWDGTTQESTLGESVARARHALADAARRGDWPKVFRLFSRNKQWINATRPGGSAWYAPLHQAAWHGAPVAVVERLVGLGGWRTHRNARGERPLDVAERRGHRHLFEALAPIYKRHVPMRVLSKVQAHFHAVIRDRAEHLVVKHQLRLPELEPLLELDERKLDQPGMWFPVLGMVGGFHYWLEVDGIEPKLVSESWCRVVGGSGQRHEVTSLGGRLVDVGFV